MEKELFGLVINDNERRTIYEISKKYNLKSFDNLEFILNEKNHLFAFTKNSIGLCGTIIMKNIKEVVHSASKFDKILSIED